jgi:hypothetical protein
MIARPFENNPPQGTVPSSSRHVAQHHHSAGQIPVNMCNTGLPGNKVSRGEFRGRETRCHKLETGDVWLFEPLSLWSYTGISG